MGSVELGMNSLTKLITDFVDGVLTTTGTGYSATATETHTFPTPAAVTAETSNGTIAIHGENREDVSVTVTKRAHDEVSLDEIEFTTRGGEDEVLHLRSAIPSGTNGAVDLSITVPETVPVDRVETKNGRIEIGEIVGDVRVSTTNGQITAENVEGYLDLTTTNGQITVRGCSGVDRVQTVNGQIHLELDSIRDETVVSTETGQIIVLTGPHLDADVTLDSTVGRVEAPVIGGSASGIGANEVTGTIGEGTHPLRIETNVGSVELRERAPGNEADAVLES